MLLAAAGERGGYIIQYWLAASSLVSLPRWPTRPARWQRPALRCSETRRLFSRRAIQSPYARRIYCCLLARCRGASMQKWNLPWPALQRGRPSSSSGACFVLASRPKALQTSPGPMFCHCLPIFVLAWPSLLCGAALCTWKACASGDR